MAFRIASVLLAFLAPTAFATTAFTLNGNPSCNNGLKVSVNSFTCDDQAESTSGACDLGEKAHVEAVLTMGYYYLSYPVMTNRACLFGISSGYTCRDLPTTEDFCSYLDADSYGSCPSANSQTSVSTSFDIPGQGAWSLGSGWYILLYTDITMEGSSQSYHCTTRIDAVSSSSRAAAFFVASAALLAGTVTLRLWMHKRRTTVIVDLAADERETQLIPMAGGGIRV